MKILRLQPNTRQTAFVVGVDEKYVSASARDVLDEARRLYLDSDECSQLVQTRSLVAEAQENLDGCEVAIAKRQQDLTKREFVDELKFLENERQSCDFVLQQLTQQLSRDEQAAQMCFSDHYDSARSKAMGDAIERQKKTLARIEKAIEKPLLEHLRAIADVQKLQLSKGTPQLPEPQETAEPSKTPEPV